MNERNLAVNAYMAKAKHWQEEIEALRTILIDCQLSEELKWGKPCYSFNNKNVIIIYGLKDYCGLGFFKGALLKDVQGILFRQGENSQAVRLIRFTTVQEITDMTTVLKAYVLEAIKLEKAGTKVDFKEKNELVFSEELKAKFKENPSFKRAFEALTAGRKRAYNLYFSAPKQSKTRVTRVEKYVQQILDGKGFHDCTCGLSKKMPSCDGSHKFIALNQSLEG